MSLGTTLNRTLGLISGKGGVEHWWAQRLTAIALIPLGLWLIFSFARLDNFDYLTVTGWTRSPINSILLIFVVITISYHSQLGLKVIIEDYIHIASLKKISLVFSNFLHVGLIAVGIYSITKVAFSVPL